MEALQLKITGEKKITTLLTEYTWTHEAKLEQDFVLDNTDVDGRTFDLTEFTTIDFLVVSSDKPFDVTIAKASGDITVKADRTFLLSPMENLTSVQIISTTSEGQKVSVRIYEGE